MIDKPRVLVIENATGVTGGLKAILRNCVQLKNDFEFIFVLPRAGQSTAMVKLQGFEVHELAMREIRRNLYSWLIYFPTVVRNSFKLGKLIRDLKISLVVNNDFYNMLVPIYQKLGGKIPYVSFIRFRPSKFPRALINFWFYGHVNQAVKVIAVSEAVRRELPPDPKVVVVYDGIRTEEFLRNDSHIILYLANYIPGKGQDLAVQTFANLHKQYPEWKLRFVGSDMNLPGNKMFKQELAELSVKLACHHKVEWGGFTENVDAEYAQASIVLNFSESESFSLTCLEAMAAGCAVIATRCGGPEEIIDDGKDGLLVSVNDIKRMTERLNSLMAKPDLRKQLGAAARQSMLKKFNLLTTARNLKSIYDQALGRVSS